MNYLSILELFAELSIAVVGFSGLVAALKFSTMPKDPLERIQLSVLLGYGFGGVLWAVLPLILLQSGQSEEWVWRYSSLAFFTMMIGFAAYRIRQASGQTAFAGTTFGVLAVSQMIALGANGYLATGILFVLVLLSNLSIGVLLFWRLIRVNQHATDDVKNDAF